MSQAESLLNSLDVAYEDTPVSPSSERKIVIGDDRYITVPEELKRIAVQYDHNVETVTFEAPRYWDGLDMSQMTIYINYLLSNGYKDAYLAQNITTQGDRMTFDWTITDNVTNVSGSITFLVCIKKTDSDGIQINHWNSELNTDLYVSKGLECVESSATMYSDIITQLLLRMDEVEAIATEEAMQNYTNTWLEANSDDKLAEIEAKGAEVLDSIPENYTTTYNLAEEAARKKAEAIELEESGEIIFLNDSSDSYLLGLNVYGKTTQVKTTGAQLFNAETNETINNGVVTLDVYDDVITYRGNDVHQAVRLRLPNDAFIPGKTYVIECDELSTGLICQAIANNVAGSGSVIDARLSSNTTRVEFTVPSDVDMSIFETFDFDVAYFAVSLFVSDTYYVNKQLRVKGLRIYSTDKPLSAWEPYSNMKASPCPECPQPLENIVNPSVKIYSKNLINVFTTSSSSNKSIDVSEDGYTMTVIGGSDNPYTSSAFHIDVEMVRGKTVVLKIDSMTATDSNARASAQANVRIPLNKDETSNRTEYFPVDSNTPIRVIDVPYNANNFTIGVYTNNTGSALASDNTVVVKGLGLYLFDEDWEQFKPKQTNTLNRTLCGIPVSQNGNYTDSNGQQWICDEIDFENGKFIQRVNYRAFDGTENWYSYGATDGFYRYNFNDTTNTMAAGVAKCLCTHYISHGPSEKQVNVWMNATGSTHQQFRIVDTFPTVEDLKTFLTAQYDAGTPVTYTYALAAPTETSLSEEEIEAFKEIRTNATNTTFINNYNAGMKVKYVADIAKYIFKNVSYKKTRFDVHLIEENWVESTDGRYYTQLLDVDVRQNSEINLTPTAEQQVSLILDGIAIFIANDDGVVTAYSLNGTPGKDMTIQASESVVVYG